MADAASSSVAAVPRPYRGVSATDRRHQRRQRLIDAGLQLFGTRGIAAVGIVDVCAEAGLTKRYFYENFASIDALAEAVFEHVTGNLVAMVAPAIEIGAGRDPRPALTVYIRALLSDPRVVRLLAVESQTGPLKKYHDGFPTRAVELWFAFASRRRRRYAPTAGHATQSVRIRRSRTTNRHGVAGRTSSADHRRGHRPACRHVLPNFRYRATLPAG